MSEPDNGINKELAEQLWDRQGREEDRVLGDWLEAEYKAHPSPFSQPPNPAQDQAGLHMRGLGAPDAREPEPEAASPRPHSLAAVAAFVFGLVTLWMLLRKSRPALS